MTLCLVLALIGAAYLGWLAWIWHEAAVQARRDLQAYVALIKAQQDYRIAQIHERRRRVSDAQGQDGNSDPEVA
jgi:hypothetical protein